MGGELERQDIAEERRNAGEDQGGGESPRSDSPAGDPLDHKVNCWACTTLVQVPVVDGALAPDFKVLRGLLPLPLSFRFAPGFSSTQLLPP